MRRMTKSALCLFVCVVSVFPAFAQSGENNAWQAIEDQRDLRRKAELIESFIKNYTSSGRRPDADIQLIGIWAEDKNQYQKIMQWASDYQSRPPSADPKAKVIIYSQAMAAAASLSNNNKTGEFGGYALDADPNNLTVLTFLAVRGLPNAPKALEYARKSITLPRPAGMSEETYNVNMGRMHGLVALPLFQEQKYKEAKEHLEIAAKAIPKDQGNHYRLGFISMGLMAEAANTAQNANTDLIKAMNAQPKDQPAVDAATKKVEDASKEALALRDAALESFAKALAIGGTLTPQVQPMFDSLYTIKNKSLDGKDQLIAQKKAELGL